MKRFLRSFFRWLILPILIAWGGGQAIFWIIDLCCAPLPIEQAIAQARTEGHPRTVMVKGWMMNQFESMYVWKSEDWKSLHQDPNQAAFSWVDWKEDGGFHQFVLRGWVLLEGQLESSADGHYGHFGFSKSHLVNAILVAPPPWAITTVLVLLYFLALYFQHLRRRFSYRPAAAC